MDFIQTQHRQYENNLRQENFILKQRIQLLERTLKQIVKLANVNSEYLRQSKTLKCGY